MNEIPPAPLDTQSAYRASDNTETDAVHFTNGTLRWWPAASLLLVAIALKFVPTLVDSPSLPVLMIGFFGPAAVCLLLMGWWVLASRASWREKLTGLVGMALLAGTSIALLDLTMKGMSVASLLFPTGVAAFSISLILLANRPNVRLVVALIAAATGFGYWDLVRSDGVTGSFAAELAWRWEPTAEQEYIASLKGQNATTENTEASDGDVLTAIDVNLATAEWPSFRGTQRDGKQFGATVDEDWEKNPPRRVWSSKIGPGWSSFTVAGNHLFTQEQRGDNEAVVCLDANTGKSLWSCEYPGRFWEAIAGAGPRATPTLAPAGLFALGADGALLCLKASTGEVVWQRDLKKDAQRKPPMWGFSSSPLVCAGVVVVHAGGAGELGVLAYDEVTGDLRWSVASGDHSYSSPQLAKFGDTTGILMQTNVSLQFLSVEDGKTIWEHEWKSDNYRALQPLVMGDSVIMATSLGLGSRRLAVSQDANSWSVKEVWTSRDMKPDFNDFVDYQGNLYGFDGNVFACIDVETGERKWKRGRYGNGQVLLLPEKGQLLVITEKGDLVLVRATPDDLMEVARLNVLTGKCWNHPVLIGSRLYVRNAQEAACFELTPETIAPSPQVL